MPTTWYVDQAHGGSDAGTIDNPFNGDTGIQKAIDNVSLAAGDTVLVTGTFTISAAIDFDGASGTRTAPIIFKGVNGSWAEASGTRAKITSSTNTHDGLALNGQNFIQLHNFEIESTAGSPGDGINCIGATDGWMIVNCYIHGWTFGVDGTGSQLLDNCCFVRSEIASNSSHGVNRADSLQQYIFCRFHDNGGNGIYSVRQMAMYGCLFYDNTGDGVEQTSSPTMCCHSVFHGNTANGLDHDTSAVLIGSRFAGNGTIDLTNNTTADKFPLIYCYIEDTPAAEWQNVTIIGTATSTVGGTDTDDGFVNTAGNDYNLASGATVRNVEEAIDATNSIFMSAGLTIDGAGSGGGGGVKLAGLSGGLIG